MHLDNIALSEPQKPKKRFRKEQLDALTVWEEKILGKSFKNKETEKIYTREGSGKIQRDIQQVALRKLRMMNNAKKLNDLRIQPANRLEKLKGDRKGVHSIRINDQWRICFIWRDGDAYEVEITAYH